jgi:putative transposase
MPRLPRVDYPGARHHVMNRGARREPLFYTDHHCAEFIGFLSELPRRFGLAVHAYALMPNHFHLSIESTRGELSRGMAFVAGRYAEWLNANHQGWDGPVYRGRFKSKLVESEEHWHFLPIYLHLNPVRSGLVGHVSLSSWTSHGAYSGEEAVPVWLTVSDLLAGYGGHRGYSDYLREVNLGRSGPPDGFERVLFEKSRRRKGQDDSESRITVAPVASDQVLRVVAGACGVAPDELRVTRRGRQGNLPRRLAAYALVVFAGLKAAEAAAILDMHPVRVSQCIAGLRQKRHRNRVVGELMSEIAEMLNCDS